MTMFLSKDEITAVSNCIRSYVNVKREDDPECKKLRFVCISLREQQQQQHREAEVITVEPETGAAKEYVVSLLPPAEAKVISVIELPLGTQPMLTPDDCFLAEEIVQSSEEVQKVLKERYSIDDISKTVACDPWSVHIASTQDKEELVGVVVPQQQQSPPPRRLVQTFLYHRQYGTNLEDNHYAHPIDILPVVDLNSRSVVAIQGVDRMPPPKIPSASVQYHRDLIKTNSYLATEWRNDRLSKLDVVQPDGPSFTVSEADNVVEWQKWKFQVEFHYREGLILRDITFGGRSVCRRASLVEMAVPYADPRPPMYTRKCAFDVGDYGLGYCANSLDLGCDCLGHIHYFDGYVVDAAGTPVYKPKVVCMHEEDAGLLWKHVEYRNGYSESRRSRELIISIICTVVNYEYLFYWHFRQDGTFELEIKLSGELSTNMLSEGEESPTHGVLVAPGVNAQIHQHMFCARLDMAVDGDLNTVSEVDVVAQPPDPQHNPCGNAFGATETVLESEQLAIRKYDATKARSWRIFNGSGSVNSINNKPTGYKLLPFARGAAQPTLMAHPSSAVAKKGAFAQANLWVTCHNPNQRYPAGEYTPQGDGSEGGLPEWASKDQDLVGKELSIWHAFGVCHIPRVEDFPVMPCEVTGFMLKPDNFFDGNPSVDLAPDKNEASKLASGCCNGGKE